MNFKALLNTISNSSYTLPLVVLYVTEGCNLSCMTCSYRSPGPDELSLDEIGDLAGLLSKYGLRHIVYSGGEPLFRRDFPEIVSVFSAYAVKQSLLTNGLLLEKRLDEIVEPLSEIIVSVDGPSAPVHDSIRGALSFDRIVSGIRKLLARTHRPRVSIRAVLQKRNFRSLVEHVDFAADIGVDRISFLAPDTTSMAFGRSAADPGQPNSEILLSRAEATEFLDLVNTLVSTHEHLFRSGFISDSPQRMRHIARYFEARAYGSPLPVNLCNAPMVSAVITATGDILPCYFLPSFGNVRGGDLTAMLNNAKISETRSAVRKYALNRCKTCVCTLHINPLSALMDRF